MLMAVMQGSEQGQHSAEQAACESRVTGAGRLAMPSQGRAGGGIRGLRSFSWPCLIVIFYLSFLFTFLVLEGGFDDDVVHEQEES